MGKYKFESEPYTLQVLRKMFQICFFLALAVTGFVHSSSIYGGEGNSTRPNAQRYLKRSSRATSQFVDCYEYSNLSGDRVRAIDYVPDLRNYNFDNRISSCCFTGIWLLYGEYTYNKYSTGSANWWAHGDNYCTDVPAQFMNAASSLRYTGAPDDWKFSTLNLYFNDYFIGDEEFMYQDMAYLNYDNQAMSIVVTGCQPWTIYADTSYRGYSMCVYPSDTSSCAPGLYTTSASLSGLGRQISSARKGCYSEVRVLPDNHANKMANSAQGSSGFFPLRK